MLFKIGVFKNYVTFTGKQQCWQLQAFFCRTPTVAASGFSRQQILFSAESGIYCWQSHRSLLRTPLETRVKRQKQRLKLPCKKGVFTKFCKFHRKTTVLKYLLKSCSFIKKRLQHRCFPVEFTKVLRTPNLKSANACFRNLFFHLDCLF